MAPHSILSPGKSHGWRSLVGYSPWGHWESDTAERLHFHFSLSCIGEGNGNPLQCSCFENPRDRGAWWAAVYGVAQSRTRLKLPRSSSSSSSSSSSINTLDFPGGSDGKVSATMRETPVQSVGREDLLEKQIATRSSILAWEIPWKEDPARLQSMGSQRVRHDWATSLSLINTLKGGWKLLLNFRQKKKKRKG